jgi:predicted nucleic acid-binding protein
VRLIRHLLDSSAILAHYFHEAGVDVVDQLLADKQNAVGICVISLLEVEGRLTEEGVEAKERDRALRLYRELCVAICPVDEPVVAKATELKAAARPRLPAIDALIAGCAASHGAVLVHADPHMDAIPERFLAKIRLPSR